MHHQDMGSEENAVSLPPTIVPKPAHNDNGGCRGGDDDDDDYSF